ncbi:hypothetical protein K7X08_002681 [Anisodus acutangulus]|uniref:Uncharacterized protein n=1 Tax=Anisodus acutangulus TaxID=402998 RepID=A0A9Q1L165_9SOLA|nr:hypothetical protein K7X08_002681 [Anisodus acutangulus]
MAFTVCGSSNNCFFVPFIAKNGDAYGRWLLQGVVHPIAALSLSLPRMAMRMDAGFYKGVVCPIDASLSLSLPRMAMQKWTLAFTVCGLSSSRFFVPFIANNGDAEVNVGFYVCGSSNNCFFVPFIAKNGDAYGRWLFRCGSSYSRLFVPFIAKNGDAYGRWLYKGVVHPIADYLSFSLPRMAMQKWKSGFTVCGSSNSRFFVLSLPRMAMQKWTLAFKVCG